MPKTIQNGGFTNPLGAALNGNLLLILSQDAKSAANPNQVAPIATRLAITGGNVAATLIYFNDELLPNNTYYTATAYDASGNKVYGPEIWSLTGAGPLDLGTLTPLLISPDPLFSNPVLQNPAALQTITGQGLTLTATAPLTVQGALTVSGTAATPNLNDILWVGPGAGSYNTVAAAEAAAGNTNKTIIVIRSTYAGTDCPVASTNRTVWDFRGTAAAAACNQNTIEYNTDDGNVRAQVKAQQNLSTIDAAGSNVGHWLLSVYNNGATGNLVEGASTEAVIGGTFTANTLTLLQGNESVASVQSTGGTVTNAVGVNGYVNNTLGSTTAITTAVGLKGTGCSGTIASATKPTNCYGLYGVDQFSTATGKNYALGVEGPARFIWSPTDGFAGWDLDDNSGAPHPFVRMLSGTNRSDIQAINTNGLGLNSSDGTAQANITTAGVGVSLIQNIAHTATMGLTLKKGSGAGNYTSASTTYAVVDSTNLCFTVTIPTGWKLKVDAEGAFGTVTAVVQVSAALTDNAACSTANAGVLAENAGFAPSAGNAQPFGLTYVINGDGASHSIALQYKTANAADSALIVNGSSTLLPTMTFLLMPSN